MAASTDILKPTIEYPLALRHSSHDGCEDVQIVFIGRPSNTQVERLSQHIPTPLVIIVQDEHAQAL